MKNNLMFIANWKMKLNFDEQIYFTTSNYDQFVQLAQKNENTIILCPSYIGLHPITQMFESTKIETGGQNCSQHSHGSFTGQVSAQSLHLAGCKYCIIGHSECRKEYKESNHEITKKFEQLINQKVSPIICVGENLNKYKEGKTINVLNEQLEEIFKVIKINSKIVSYLNICIAYEPIWSIGTNNIPTKNHLESIFAWLHKKTAQLSKLAKFKLIYGGSVSSKNITFFKKIQNLDGFLIGRASLDFQELKKIVEL